MTGYNHQLQNYPLTIPRLHFPPPMMWIWCEYWTTFLIILHLAWKPLSTTSTEQTLHLHNHLYDVSVQEPQYCL